MRLALRTLCALAGGLVVAAAVHAQSSSGTSTARRPAACTRPRRSPSSCAPRSPRRPCSARYRTACGGSWTSPEGRSKGPASRARCVPAAPIGRSCEPTASPSWITRYTIETDKGQLVYVQNAGMRHAPPDGDAETPGGAAGRPGARLLQDDSEVRDLRAGAPVADARSVCRPGERYPTEVVVRFWRVELGRLNRQADSLQTRAALGAPTRATAGSEGSRAHRSPELSRFWSRDLGCSPHRSFVCRRWCARCGADRAVQQRLRASRSAASSRSGSSACATRIFPPRSSIASRD